MALAGYERIERAITVGCKKAAKSYTYISGDPAYSVPESYIQSCIFQEVGKIYQLYISLECSDKVITLQTGHALPDGFLDDVRRGRFDAIIWYKNERPRTIVEIKKFYSASTFDDDVKRIKYWLENSHLQIQSGYLVGLTTAQGPKADTTLKSRFSKLANRCGGSLRWLEIERIAKTSTDRKWAIGLIHITM